MKVNVYGDPNVATSRALMVAERGTEGTALPLLVPARNRHDGSGLPIFGSKVETGASAMGGNKQDAVTPRQFVTVAGVPPRGKPV